MQKDRGRGIVGNRSALERIKRLYFREFASVSENVYYSIIFERDYPTLSDIFESAAFEGVEGFRRIGASIGALGGDPSLNLRLGQSKAKPVDLSRISAQDIRRIIGYVTQRERSSISLCEDIAAASDDADTIDVVSDIVLKKEELCVRLKRILDS